jgi:hypothetical protein
MNKNPEIVVAVGRGVVTFFVAWCFLGVLVMFILPPEPPNPPGTPPEQIDETTPKLFFVLIILLSMILGVLEGVRYWIDDRKKEKYKRMSDLC